MNLLDWLWEWLTGRKDQWQPVQPAEKYTVIVDAAVAEQFSGDPCRIAYFDEYGVDLTRGGHIRGVWTAEWKS